MVAVIAVAAILCIRTLDRRGQFVLVPHMIQSNGSFLAVPCNIRLASVPLELLGESYGISREKSQALTKTSQRIAISIIMEGRIIPYYISGCSSLTERRLSRSVLRNEKVVVIAE